MKRLVDIGAIAVALAIAAGAYAQDNRYRDFDNNQNDRWQDQQGRWHRYGENQPYGYGQPGQAGSTYGSQQQQGTPYQYLGQYGQGQNLTGTILEVRELQLQDWPQPHVLAKVRLQDGYVVVADLGGARRLENQQIRFEQGQRVTLSGVMGRINERPVLVVDRVITADNRTIETRRMAGMQSQPYGQSGQQGYGQRYGQQQYGYGASPPYGQPQPYGYSTPSQAGNYAIRGRITDVKDIDNPSGQGKERILTVRTDTGQDVLVNAGKRSEARAENLTKGQDVQVFGYSGTVDNKSGIIATGINNTPVNQSGYNQPQPYAYGTPSQQGSYVIRGRITDVKDVDARSGDGKERILTVRTDMGQDVLVNAGKRSEAKAENLKKGQDVEVFGYSGAIDKDNRQGIVATGVNNITPGNRQDQGED